MARRRRYNYVLVYVACCVYRLVNAWLLYTQFDPDEYWQSLEPAYCRVFSSSLQKNNCALTWEWLGDEPIRSYVSIVPTFLFYKTVHALQHFLTDATISWLVSRGPLYLHAILVTVPTDLCIYCLSSCEGWCLFCSLTSWFHGYALARTYSNSLETVLLLLGLVLIQHKKTKLAFFLGGISVSIRFTALAAWIPLGMHLAFFRQENKRTSIRNLVTFLFYPCAIFGLLGVLAAMMVDYHFYGKWTLTLLNNVVFNVVENNGALYGTHSWHWYLTGGIPAITGTMFLLLVWDLTDLLTVIPQRKDNKRRTQRKQLWTIIGCYTLLHSCNAHKEFRFLLPILPLCCILAGYRMKLLYLMCTSVLVDSSSRSFLKEKVASYKVVLIVMITVPIQLNLLPMLYLSQVHQRSPISVNRYIVESLLKTDSTLLSSSNVDIHYLMGCHSTPAYSHLHVPKRPVTIWTLDCSPNCRRAKNCESDAFLTDPKSFVYDHYRALQKEDICKGSNETKDTCRADTASNTFAHQLETPDFMAVFVADVLKIGKDAFDALGLQEEARFIHCVMGMRIRIGYGYLHIKHTDRSIYSKRSAGRVDVYYDEMVLFTKKKD